VFALEQRLDFSPLSDLQERTTAQPWLRHLLYAEGFLSRSEANPSTISSSSAFFVAARLTAGELWKSHHKSSRYLDFGRMALSCMSAKPYPTTLLSSRSKCLPQKSRPNMSSATGVAVKGMYRTWAPVELVLPESPTSQLPRGSSVAFCE
jgi:hypothetical protein